jgi:hypothetical protein
MLTWSYRRQRRSRTLLALCLFFSFGAVTTFGQIEYESGDFYINMDSLISYGVSSRIADRDEAIIGLNNAERLGPAYNPNAEISGTAYSVNGDDGNLNFDKGIFSNVFKITSEVLMSYRNVGAFIRGTGFYDIEAVDGDRERTELSDRAITRVGKRFELLDAYAWLDFNLGDMPGSLRAGNQVLSWGESTFIQNGINVINPIDVSAFRLPGSELKEALLPEGLVSLNLGLSENLTIEAFYQYQWNDTEPDPPGSYFSSTDIAGDGAEKVLLSFAAVPDFVNPGDRVSAPVGGAVGRLPDVEPEDGGQYGLAFRIFAPALNDTEFGLYFVNFHSRLPVISGRTGTLDGVLDLDYAATAGYFLEYVEDIKLFGVSFNTMLGASGIAIQGEWSVRNDAPLQIDDVELLYAALSALGQLEDSPGTFTFLGNTNQIGAFGWDEKIPGFIRRSVSQPQMSLTKAFGPIFGSDQAVLVWEGAMTYVHNMPDKNFLRLEAPGTYVTGNEIHFAAGVQPGVEPASAFADRASFGYRLAGRMDYNNAIAGWNLSPSFSWQHDVNGNSPGPGGNFIEGRKAITVGLTGTYVETWSVGLSYTNFFGAGRYNLINDRDFISINGKYNF